MLTLNLSRISTGTFSSKRSVGNESFLPSKMEGSKTLQQIRTRFARLAAAVSLLAGLSCKDEIAGTDSDPIVFPQSNISFSRHVEPLFQQRCAFGGCHAGSNAASELDLSLPAYSKLMNHQPRLVTSGSSNNSLLFQKIG